MVCVVLGVMNMAWLKRRVVRDSAAVAGGTPPHARLVALTSLALWVGATTAGRLMGYLGPVSGID